MNDAELRAAIAQFLSDRSTMALATCGNGPWAASVFFVSDAEFRLYFVTDPRTRHGRHLLDSGTAAAAINDDCQDWMTIQGIQLEGSVAKVESAQRPHALRLYLEKFPAIARLVDSPAGEPERLIGERLAASPFFRLQPRRIRLIDNTRGFGSKSELVL